jgi:glycosyltransferase involved in cell wall biosynthesis
MRIAHVIPSFYPAFVYGGPVKSVFQLCCYLTKLGVEVRVLTTDANGRKAALGVETGRETEVAQGVRVRYCRRLSLDAVSPSLLALLPSYIRWSDVIHLTATYSFPTIPTLLLCRLMHKPVVWSPRGALQRWEKSTRQSVKGVWESLCLRVAPGRMLLHVTSEEEGRESRERFPEIQTVTIANGVEVPELKTQVSNNGTLRLIYLGRLHPKKGIENLLAACALLKKSALRWSLAIAGAGETDYLKRIRGRIQELALSDYVKIIGGIGDDVTQVFARADVLVLPSFTENFGMVVVEALAHGVPVIASRKTPWARLEEMGCGLWVENSPASLASAIHQIAHMSLREMGQNGREWMEAEFRWESVAGRMRQVYSGLL